MLIVAFLCAFAYVFGLYTVAPGGEYALGGIEPHSWNPTTYAWFFQSFGNAYLAIGMTIFGGITTFVLIGLPVAIVLSLLLTLVKPFAPAVRKVAMLDRRCLVVPPIAFWLLGLAQTIHNGVNPGVCC